MIQRGALASPMSRPKPRRHVIAAISYAPGSTDYDAAPVECTCGWTGYAGGYAAHRTAEGQLSQRRPDLTRVFPDA